MGTKQPPAPPGAPGSPAAAAAAAAAARRRFQAAGRAVIAGLKMGAEAARRRKADAELPPDPELQELLVGVDGQLHEVASMRASASGQARAKHLLHKCSGCDGDVASCVALLQSRTMEAGSAAHRHEMLRMVRLFSSEHAGSEPGRPPPLGRLYEDPVSEYWDMVCLRGLRALLRECLCTQSSRLAREQRMTRIQSWFRERARTGRLAGDILATAPPRPKAVQEPAPPPPKLVLKARMGGKSGVAWVCGNHEGSGLTPRSSAPTHSMGRMPSTARMSLER